MSTANAKQILFPVGRMVRGSLSVGQDKDAEGRPLVNKTGPDAGKPRLNYFFAVAYKKAEAAWWDTAWGRELLAIGRASFPGGQADHPTFAWKVTDGDATHSKKPGGPAPVSIQGYAGHWVVSFSSGYAPKVYDAKGATAVDAVQVKCGYFIQVYATVDGNESAQQPGIYINHNMVAFSGFGPEIYQGPDPTSVGFGASPLPAGASSTPLTTMTPPGTPPPAAPPGGAPYPQPGGGSLPPPPAYVPPPAAVPPPTTVAPHPGILPPGAAGAPPPPPPAAAAPPPPVAGPTMTAKATTTYAAYRQAGWSDDQLRASGLMI